MQRRQRPNDRKGRQRLVELRAVLRHPATNRREREAALAEIEALAPILPKFVRKPMDPEIAEAFETLPEESVSRALKFYLASSSDDQARIRRNFGGAFSPDLLKWISVEYWRQVNGEFSLLQAQS